MDTVSINDEKFTSTEGYREFMKNNPSYGYLKIRAYAAREAVPISGLQVTVSTIIDNTKVIFFEGETDISGTIEKIALPAPTLNLDNSVIPPSTTYEIESIYLPDNSTQIHKVNMYANILVVQNISIVPEISFRKGSSYGC